MRGACLRLASLFDVYFFRTQMDDVDLSEAAIDTVVFGDVDLSAVHGLDTVQHMGPSEIGINTVHLSRGNIPEIFLRGAGVPNELITYTRSLFKRAYEFYSCFISCDDKDQEFAERLYADLHSNDVRCWFASEDLKTGDKILDRINHEIHYSDKLLIILSGNSIDSELVKTEVREALKKERQTKRTVLFPIRLDDIVMKADAAWIEKIRRERVITDFHDWKDHDIYQRQFARLLRDLRAMDAQKAVEPAIALPPKAGTMPTVQYRASLRKNLVAWFDDSELRDLCFDIGVDYESLGGKAKSGKARELVAFCERTERVPDLVAKCKELRPKVSWEGEYE